MATCLENCQKLYDAIMARASGEGIQSSGHRDRQVAFAQVSLESMVKLYQQSWNACPAAQAALPQLTELEASAATRGTLRIRVRH